MNASSLRLRLLIGAAVWIALALVLAGVVIVYLFTANIERTARGELANSLARIVAVVDPDRPTALEITPPLSDPRYEKPLGGAYWQVDIVGSGESVRSRSLWDGVLRPDVDASVVQSYGTLAGPGGQAVLALSMLTRFNAAAGEKALRITVAQDRAVMDEAISRFGVELAIALLALGLALILAAWLQVSLGLIPLSRLREGIGALRREEREVVPGTYPSEVMPLVGEVNELLASQRKSMEFARARAADLAHGLKTPLAVLSTIAEKLRNGGQREIAASIEGLTEEMADRIDYQLRLSRLRLRTRSHRLAAPLNQAVKRTVAVLMRTRDGERLRWDVNVPSRLVVDIDPQDLIELLGVLLENAAQWAQSSVSIIGTVIDNSAELTIRDDGEGVASAQIVLLGERGRRLDESKPGSGLGLSIAKEIIGLNNGHISFASDRSGFTASVRLPLASEVD